MPDEVITHKDLLREERELEEELRHWYAAPGDKLFVETAESAILDPLGFTAPGEKRNPMGRWELYSSGFLHAADKLVEQLKHLAYEDELIYPILTLYRHHVELELKMTIRGAPNFSEDVWKQIKGVHNLKTLWDKLGEIDPEAHRWTNKEHTTVCKSLIAEFATHDPQSQAARYPVDKAGNQNLEKLYAIDLSILKLRVHQISHYLDAIVTGRQLEAEARADYEADYFFE